MATRNFTLLDEVRQFLRHKRAESHDTVRRVVIDAVLTAQRDQVAACHFGNVHFHVAVQR